MADSKPLAQFTRGPLHITREVDSEGYCQHTVRASSHAPLAVLSNYSPHEQLANAALYAAAPELFNALTEFMSNAGLSDINRDDSRFDRARAAIARATTRPTTTQPAQGEAQ